MKAPTDSQLTKRDASADLEEVLKDESPEATIEHLHKAFDWWRKQNRDGLKDGVQYQQHLRAEWE